MKYFTALAAVITLNLSLGTTAIAQNRSWEETYRVNHEFTGVHRCAHTSEKRKEADLAVQNKVRQLEKDMRGRIYVDVVGTPKILSANTRRWQETDRIGLPKGRKCTTYMQIDATLLFTPARSR